MIEELGIKTLDDVDPHGKTVFVRVDFNSPIDPRTKRILDDSRIRAHAETLREIVERGGKAVVLSHQGRRGEPDFVSLEQHAAILRGILEVPVRFVNDIFGERAKRAVERLKAGEVLVLENVRFWEGETLKKSPEEHSKSELVENLAPLVDVFCVDAFAAAHRMHASLVGFMPVAPEVVAGRVMERELRVLYRVRNSPSHPCVYVLGGAKAEDSADLSMAVLSYGIADYVLTGGLVGQLFLYSTGVDLGEKNVRVLEEKGFLELVDRIRELISSYPDRVKAPLDFAVDAGGVRKEVPADLLPTEHLIKDIGAATVEEYARILREAETVVMNGPMGVFEEDAFAWGTERIFAAIAGSKALSLIGGGHTVAAASKLGYGEKFGYVSTAGGALIEYLIKGTLPVVEALKRYSK